MNRHDYKVGDGATISLHSDRYACTVIKVTPATVTLQRDKATLLNGFKSEAPDKLTSCPGGFCAHVDGTQRYDYAADPDGVTYVARLTKRGLRTTLGKVSKGRNEHYDFNF